MSKRSHNMVSPELLSAVKKACRDLLPTTTDFTTCVSALKIAKHKAVASAFVIKSPVALRPFVLAAVGQMHGFEARPGAGGGVRRVKTTRNRKPTQTQATQQTTAQDVPENDNSDAAASTQEAANA